MRVHAFTGLVARPEVVAERLDDMVCRYTDMSDTGLEHAKHATKYAASGPNLLAPGIHVRGESVEVAKQLVSTVQYVDIHRRNGLCFGQVPELDGEGREGVVLTF